MVYDNYGRQTSLSDPNAGTVTYGYNNLGELTFQTDSRNLTRSLTYDNLGRVLTQVSPEGTKTFTYDPSGNPGLLSSVTFPGGSETYNYDPNSRITGKVENIDGTSYTTGYGYDSYSRLETITYPSNFAIKNVYNTFGYQSEVRRDDNNSLIWEGQDVNAFGQFTRYTYGNNLTTTKAYNSQGMLNNISTGSVQNMDYSFDMERGNLLSSHDNLHSLTELFSYDDLNRLTGVGGPAPLTMSYSSNGNILSKTSVGDYSYDGPKPHAVTSVTNIDGLIPTITQRVTLTSFNKVDSIIQGNLVYTLAYGHGDQRTISRLYDDNVLQKTVYYVGGYEKEVKPGNNIRQIHYIAGGDGLAAIFVKNNGLDTLYYIHTDHLGSINVITNQSGAVVKNYSFDAWGRRRNPVNWTYNNIPSTFLFSRGFTGHEHLDQFDLVNMNGRVYDPLMGRFLSPDNFVQSTDFTQSFNRYGYCMNNPLIYSDPDGNFFIIDSWLIGLFSGGWKEANKRAANDIKILGGLFASDPNKGFFGRVWETISRFTWQLPQTIGGWGTAQAYNTLGLEGGVESVKYKYGATVVSTHNSWDGAAVTQGSFIVGGSDLEADPNDSIFQHEYGHYIQSQSMGWAYYPRVGLPSAGSEHGKYKLNYPSHDYHPVEQDANRRAFLYFNKHVTGFQNDTYLSDNLGWNFVKNPLDVYKTGQGIYIDYNNSYDLQLLNNLKVRATLGDYKSWLYGGPIGAALYGWYNSYNYNN